MRARARTVAALAAAALAAAPAARADHGGEDVHWPQALPARTDVPTTAQPGPVPNCADGTVACVDDLLRRLRAQWQPLDAACDHRALFSLAYIRITEGLRAAIAGEAAPRIQDPRWLSYVITTFSNRYFQALADYDAGRPVPESWRITLDEATRGDANGGQDVLLASNAHTQHDLPYVYAEMGTRTPDGGSHKPDHDAVNAVNSAVFDGLEDDFEQRYDPFFRSIDAKPLPLDEIGTIEVVKVWRETAWRNGERLLAARDAAERQQVERSIDVVSLLWAEAIRGGELPGYRERRDAYCRAARGL
jgi:hypothetical protein